MDDPNIESQSKIEASPPPAAPYKRTQSPFAWAGLMLAFVSIVALLIVAKQIHFSHSIKKPPELTMFQRFVIANGMALCLLSGVCSIIALLDVQRRNSLAIALLLLDIALGVFWLSVAWH